MADGDNSTRKFPLGTHNSVEFVHGYTKDAASCYIAYYPIWCAAATQPRLPCSRFVPIPNIDRARKHTHTPDGKWPRRRDKRPFNNSSSSTTIIYQKSKYINNSPKKL